MTRSSSNRPGRKQLSSAQSTGRRSSTAKSATKKTAAKKAAKRTVTKRAAAKTATKKTAAKKRTATAKKAASKKTANKRVAKKTTAKKGVAKKAVSKKTTAKKSASKKRAAKKTPVKKASAKKAPANKTVAKKGKKATGKAKAKPTLQPLGKRKHLQPKKGKGKAKAKAKDSDSRRNFGLRGAAPWVARHAAKHAEELRRRNAEPPPPGSARATLRTPERAEELKDQIAKLHQRISEIQTMRKKLDNTFFEIGLVLDEVQREEMFVAKGYSTFEAFIDRESGLQRGLAHRLLRIVHTFQRDTAYDYGLDRLMAALAALDGAVVTAPASNPSRPSSRSLSSAGLPRKTLRWDD